MAEKRLTDSMIKRAQPRATKYTLSDGAGLHVLVHPTGAKYFQFRFWYDKRQHVLQLGVWGKLSLKQARDDIAACHQVLREGKDPRVERKLKLQQQVKDTNSTFAGVAK